MATNVLLARSDINCEEVMYLAWPHTRSEDPTQGQRTILLKTSTQKETFPLAISSHMFLTVSDLIHWPSSSFYCFYTMSRECIWVRGADSGSGVSLSLWVESSLNGFFFMTFVEAGSWNGLAAILALPAPGGKAKQFKRGFQKYYLHT